MWGKGNYSRNVTKDGRIFTRKINRKDRDLFLQSNRRQTCLHNPGQDYLAVNKLEPNEIKLNLAYNCLTIEHQIIHLREMLQLTQADFENRYKFTQMLLTCLRRHHNIIYQGILFGSTVNGLGFRDSDVDLRLRPLQAVREDSCLYEPSPMDREMLERILNDIAGQTCECCPAIGSFVPSNRCPVAKLEFYYSPVKTMDHVGRDIARLTAGLKYDISLASLANHLGHFNSLFLRFLCHLEPKFHLMAIVLRYWSNVHELIVPGYLSSYALVNMLIHFCQTCNPPVLPSIDHMRELYLESESKDNSNHKTDTNSGSQFPMAITQMEWHCLLSMDKKHYPPSKNKELVSVLLLKFFEYYLKFPYSTHIITTRPGRALTHDEYKNSPQFHPKFSIKSYLNIQDPFDLAHNMTLGMQGTHFHRMMVVMRHSYERLFRELLNNFDGPESLPGREDKIKPKHDGRNWGLNVLFVKISDQEMKES